MCLIRSVQTAANRKTSTREKTNQAASTNKTMNLAAILQISASPLLPSSHADWRVCPEGTQQIDARDPGERISSTVAPYHWLQQLSPVVFSFTWTRRRLWVRWTSMVFPIHILSLCRLTSRSTYSNRQASGTTVESAPPVIRRER